MSSVNLLTMTDSVMGPAEPAALVIVMFPESGLMANILCSFPTEQTDKQVMCVQTHFLTIQNPFLDIFTFGILWKILKE